jgi:hypothetical protein
MLTHIQAYYIRGYNKTDKQISSHVTRRAGFPATPGTSRYLTLLPVSALKGTPEAQTCRRRRGAADRVAPMAAKAKSGQGN